LLVSESFYELLSPERKRNMRTVDRVLCEKLGADGKAVPVRLYAVAGGADEGNRTLSKKNAYTSDLEDGMEDYINGACTQMTRSVSVSVCVCLCLCLSVCLSVCLAGWLSVWLSVCLSAPECSSSIPTSTQTLVAFAKSLCLSVSLCLSLCLSVSLCVSLCANATQEILTLLRSDGSLHNAGNWPSAIKKLTTTLDQNANDKPVSLILEYMSLVKQAGDAAPAVGSRHTVPSLSAHSRVHLPTSSCAMFTLACLRFCRTGRAIG
jgi:hypothetical protein